MNNWTDGYVADIGYTYGYYSELNPLRIKQIFLYSGLKFPEIGTACELGFGQGISINVHAAASAIDWHGTDFNPSQVVFAQEMANASSSGTKLFDDSFESFASRTDLPDFDFIGIHGIWSWISDENRAIIVNFIRRKLKVGGILYISYNTLPGWSSFAPMRHLLTEHAKILGSEGYGIINRINGALEFSEKLLKIDPKFLKNSPQIAERIDKLKEQNRHYLAHEYFNRDWHPIHFATMGNWLAPAKLSYACSANQLDHLDVLNLSSEQQALLNTIPDAMFRESVRDFIVNQQFRRDYWVKGACKLSALDKDNESRTLRVILTVHRTEIVLKVTGSLGTATLSDSVYGPILDYLADHKIKSLGQIEQAVKDKGIALSEIIQAAMLLIGSGQISLAQEEDIIVKAKKRTDKLNNFIMRKANSNGDITYLASPVTGGGLFVGRFQQLFLLGLSNGLKQPGDFAQFVWQILGGQGQRIINEGKVLETEEENIKELTEQAIVFLEKQLPILKALQVV
ncbi:Methyltransferase regulatory domain-containing protein [Nitrosomonas sp. Is79A3]|uniref:methyltransferase regulatory domain-containing protein n=1 Tax=Nitrosomonas sp. (strain Is79A3) TaxID=261292 RepID=UPI000215C731